MSGALTDFPFALGQGLRYGLAFLVLLALARGRLLRPTRRELAQLAGVAAFGMVLFNLAVILAVRHAAPSSVGVIVGCSPVVLAIAGPLLQGSSPRGVLLPAAVCVAIGAGITEGLGTVSAAAVVLALAALACECLFSLLAAPVLQRVPPLQVSAWACGLGALLCVPLAAVGPAPRLPDAHELAALAFLAGPVTVGAFLGFYRAIAGLGVARAGLLIGLMPVSALLAGLLLGREALTLAPVLGATLVAAGVTLGARETRVRPATPARVSPASPSCSASSPSACRSGPAR